MKNLVFQGLEIGTKREVRGSLIQSEDGTHKIVAGGNSVEVDPKTVELINGKIYGLPLLEISKYNEFIEVHKNSDDEKFLLFGARTEDGKSQTFEMDITSKEVQQLKKSL